MQICIKKGMTETESKRKLENRKKDIETKCQVTLDVLQLQLTEEK